MPSKLENISAALLYLCVMIMLSAEVCGADCLMLLLLRALLHGKRKMNEMVNPGWASQAASEDGNSWHGLWKWSKLLMLATS